MRLQILAFIILSAVIICPRDININVNGLKGHLGSVKFSSERDIGSLKSEILAMLDKNNPFTICDLISGTEKLNETSFAQLIRDLPEDVQNLRLEAIIIEYDPHSLFEQVPQQTDKGVLKVTDEHVSVSILRRRIEENRITKYKNMADLIEQMRKSESGISSCQFMKVSYIKEARRNMFSFCPKKLPDGVDMQNALPLIYMLCIKMGRDLEQSDDEPLVGEKLLCYGKIRSIENPRTKQYHMYLSFEKSDNFIHGRTKNSYRAAQLLNEFACEINKLRSVEQSA